MVQGEEIERERKRERKREREREREREKEIERESKRELGTTEENRTKPPYNSLKQMTNIDLLRNKTPPYT